MDSTVLSGKFLTLISDCATLSTLWSVVWNIGFLWNNNLSAQL
ncbi:hypothetical protein SNOG_16464 [Parastagonospora nodorum SN15]|uniref:Uncharacterized protein n=1 Tax=Phaeosphaeria nodorum (strain SN15 / ATCC MYA-4574 / FGSC 10173) TaxID=321614 RepID=Q0TVK0_PHANO|nr:hypothetical protein SNOG_16464 [Parastagonospora nodorum SN15]EAT76162.1 hypothetical protein SNOG_16464 [Parastagonospora nodorum SN15]